MTTRKTLDQTVFDVATLASALSTARGDVSVLKQQLLRLTSRTTGIFADGNGNVAIGGVLTLGGMVIGGFTVPAGLLERVLFTIADGSTAGLQAAIIAQLTAARRGIGGQIRLSKAAVVDAATILIESADNQTLAGEGQYATQRTWSGGPTNVPWFKGDQLRALDMGDLRLTAASALQEFIRLQDDETDPTDPGAVYAVNRRSTQDLLRRMQLDGAGLADYGVRLYQGHPLAGKNDHHRFADLTVDGCLQGFVIEGQAATSNVIDKCLVRHSIGAAGGRHGLFGVRTGILPDDPRRGTTSGVTDLHGATAWDPLAGNGGTFRMYGGELDDSDIAAIYLDSRNGVNLIDGVNMEGNSRLLITSSPSPATSLNAAVIRASKFIINTDIAHDLEVIQHLGQGPLVIDGCQFGLATAPKELRFYAYSPRSFIGWRFTGCEISSPYVHGHFSGLYPDDTAGSYSQDASGEPTPLLHPWDGPGRAVPYTAEQWTSINHDVPDQWWACQEGRGTITPTSVDATANTLAVANHARYTGDGPFNTITTGTLPGGLAASTDYWLIRADSDTLKLASSQANALAGTAIDLSSAGTGTLSLVHGDREAVYSLRKFAPRLDFVLNAASPSVEPDDFPVLGVRRTYPGFAVTSVDHTTEQVTLAGHGLWTGDGPYYLTTTGTLPTDLAADTPYWIIKVDASTFKLATSLANAMAGTVKTFSSNGSGTLSVGGKWDGYWIQYDSTVGQTLSWNDTQKLIFPDEQSIAVDLLVDVTGKSVEGMLLALGLGGTTGLNVRITTAGKIKIWCQSTSATGVVDYTTKGPTLIRVVYDKRRRRCFVVTPHESFSVSYGDAPGHTQQEGIGSTSGTLESFTGFLRHAAIWFRTKAERIGNDLSRRGFLPKAGETIPMFPAGGLAGLRLAYASASTATIAAGRCRSDDDAGDIVVGASLTLDITTSGAGGLDTGSEASSTWYAVHVIDDSTKRNAPAALASTSSSAPTMPSGYDRRRLVGWLRNDGSSNFLHFSLQGNGTTRRITYDEARSVLQVLTGGSATTFTDQSLAALVPPTSLHARLMLGLQVPTTGGAASNVLDLRPNGANSSDGPWTFGPGILLPDGGQGMRGWVADVPTDASQVIEYRVSDADDDADIWVLGYELEL
jgi:hypothetical protein